jgi:hypothetical protein
LKLQCATTLPVAGVVQVLVVGSIGHCRDDLSRMAKARARWRRRWRVVSARPL